MSDERFIPDTHPELSTCHPEDSTWAVWRERENGNLHVIPLRDSKEHTLDGCECRPIVDPLDDDAPMFIHNAFDGRKE